LVKRIKQGKGGRIQNFSLCWKKETNEDVQDANVWIGGTNSPFGRLRPEGEKEKRRSATGIIPSEMRSRPMFPSRRGNTRKWQWSSDLQEECQEKKKE